MVDQMVDLYGQGLGTEMIGKKLGVDPKTVRSHLKKCKVQMRPMGSTPGQGRIYSLNENVFDELTNPNSLYFLGLILTDGSVGKDNNLQMGLQERDRSILEDLKHFLGTDKPILLREAKDNKITVCGEERIIHGGPSCHLQVTSKYICDRLRDLGLDENKSGNCRVPDECVGERDLWRGMVDGDGWVSLSRKRTWINPRVGLCGTERVCDQFADYIASLNLKGEEEKFRPNLSKGKEKINHYQVHLEGRPAQKLIAHLYHNDHAPAIERKQKMAKLVSSWFVKRDLHKAADLPIGIWENPIGEFPDEYRKAYIQAYGAPWFPGTKEKANPKKVEPNLLMRMEAGVKNLRRYALEEWTKVYEQMKAERELRKAQGLHDPEDELFDCEDCE